MSIRSFLLTMMNAGDRPNDSSSVYVEKNVPILKDNLPRFDKLRDLFESTYKSKPSFIVRVPGRVNLIGEHIDYCGFGVLPMAIEQDVLLAVSTNLDGLIRLINMDFNKYPVTEISVENFTINIPPDWYHYVLCGVQGAKDLIAPLEESRASKKLDGLNIAVWGTIPSASGLSSSSALVTASLLVTYYSAKKDKDIAFDINKFIIAETAAKCERYIGTQGGAMDQSIAVFARQGFAKYITFEPTLNCQDVPLPKGGTFFFSLSGITYNKAATDQFNARVFEVKVATLMIIKYTDIQPVQLTCPTLYQLKSMLNRSYTGMLDVVDKAIEAGKAYTVRELLICLGLNQPGELVGAISNGAFSTMQRMQSVIDNYSGGFKIHDRATHVFTEANRVENVVYLCSNEGLTEDEILLEMGTLMTESHNSCSKLYECSLPEIDSLVRDALKCGAYGARITGAGWGGGIISLVPEKEAQKFQTEMSKLTNFTVASLPSQGATIHIET